MNSEKDTLPNTLQILNAIQGLQQQLNTRIDGLQQDINARFEQVDIRFEQIDQRFDQIDRRFEQVDAKSEEMRLQMMSFDVRLDRVEASVHEVLNVSFNTRADVKVLREEVYSWSKEVRDLQLKVA